MNTEKINQIKTIIIAVLLGVVGIFAINTFRNSNKSEEKSIEKKEESDKKFKIGPIVEWDR